MDQKKTDEEITIKMSQVIGFFTRIIDFVNDPVEQFNEIKKLINFIYNVKNWSILRLDDTTNQLFFTILESDSDEILKQTPVKVGDGICGKVVSTGTYQILTDVDDKEHQFTKSIDALTGFVTQSIIAVPIMYCNKVLGVFELINVENPEVFNANPSHILLMQTIANFIGVIFSLSSTHQEIIFSSERDALTGVHNRFFLNKVLNGSCAERQFRKYNEVSDILVALIDLNNFKNVNDTFGHFAGDQVLKETAKLLAYYFRKEDIIVRYGGDEFLLLIRLDMDEESIENSVINKLDKISTSLPHQCSLSFGISKGKKGRFNQLLHTADKLMYLDKMKKKKVVWIKGR